MIMYAYSVLNFYCECFANFFEGVCNQSGSCQASGDVSWFASL